MDVAGSKMVKDGDPDGLRWYKISMFSSSLFSPNFDDLGRSHVGVVWGCIEAMCVDWKTMRWPSL